MVRLTPQEFEKLKEAKQLFDDKKFQDAMVRFDEIYQANDTNKYAAFMREEAGRRFVTTLFQDGGRLFKAGNYKEAKEKYELIAGVAKDRKSVREAEDSITICLKEIYKGAIEKAAKENNLQAPPNDVDKLAEINPDMAQYYRAVYLIHTSLNHDLEKKEQKKKFKKARKLLEGLRANEQDLIFEAAIFTHLAIVAFADGKLKRATSYAKEGATLLMRPDDSFSDDGAKIKNEIKENLRLIEQYNLENSPGNDDSDIQNLEKKETASEEGTA